MLWWAATQGSRTLWLHASTHSLACRPCRSRRLRPRRSGAPPTCIGGLPRRRSTRPSLVLACLALGCNLGVLLLAPMRLSMNQGGNRHACLCAGSTPVVWAAAGTLSPTFVVCLSLAAALVCKWARKGHDGRAERVWWTVFILGGISLVLILLPLVGGLSLVSLPLSDVCRILPNATGPSHLADPAYLVPNPIPLLRYLPSAACLPQPASRFLGGYSDCALARAACFMMDMTGQDSKGN